MSLQLKVIKNKAVLLLEGDLRHFSGVTEDVENGLTEVDEIAFDAKKLQGWNTALVAVLYEVILKIRQKNGVIDWKGMPANLQRLLMLALEVDRTPHVEQKPKLGFIEALGDWGIGIWDVPKKVMLFLHGILMSGMRLVLGKAVFRRIDFEFALEDCGYKAVGIISLVSFMVGLILAFVGALQLKMFGAQIYIASLVMIAMTRIMGAIMVGIIMAGRTGAAMAATIGTMQVNEEIDALKTFGFNEIDFLVLPRVLSLVITMPFLTILSDIMGVIGGAFVGVLVWDISVLQYWQYSVDAFGLANFLVGVFHGLVYAVIIACAGCYYGINCGRNADSVGKATTKSVVSAIVIMIVVTGGLTLMFEGLGI